MFRIGEVVILVVVVRVFETQCIYAVFLDAYNKTVLSFAISSGLYIRDRKVGCTYHQTRWNDLEGRSRSLPAAHINYILDR